MLFRGTVAAAMLGVASAASATGSTAVVCNFHAVGPGTTQNKFVQGVVVITSTQNPDTTWNTTAVGFFVGLKPFTTYDVEIETTELAEAGIPDLFTTNAFGIGGFCWSIEEQPLSFAVNPTVHVFIDGDGDLNDQAPSEQRATGTGCGCP